MAIVNGKKLYNGRKLVALAVLEDRAAAEYSWLMAGTGDDWGRFEANPRVILGNAYKHRPGVTEADVARWLKLYEEVRVPAEDLGLLRFYVVDGVTYAEWTAYAGDAESQRKHHNCPEPPWSKHKHKGTCSLWGAAKDAAAASLSNTGYPEGVPVRGTPKTYPEGQPPAPTPKVYASEPSVSSVPSGTTTDQSDNGAPPAAGTPAPAAEGDRRQTTSVAAIRTAPDNGLITPATRIAYEREALELVSKISCRTGEDPLELMADASTGNGKLPRAARKVNPATMSDDQLLHAVLDLRAKWEQVRPPELRPAWQPDPTAEEILAGVLEHLQRTVPPHVYGAWLRSWVGVGWDGKLHIHAPNIENVEWVQKNLRKQLLEALHAQGLSEHQLAFEVDRAPPAAARAEGRKAG